MLKTVNFIIYVSAFDPSTKLSLSSEKKAELQMLIMPRIQN
jgi:hypothetical protein